MRDDEHFYSGVATQETYRSPTVREVSFVSKYFRSIALRVILSELTWNISSPIDVEAEEGEQPKSRENARLCGLWLAGNPHLGASVHALHIVGESAQKSIDSVVDLDVWKDVVERVVPTLGNLHTLRLTYIPITLPLYNAVYALPDLKVFHLSDCTMHLVDGEAIADKVQNEGLGVRDLKVELQPQTFESPAQGDAVQKIVRRLIFGSKEGSLRMLRLNHVTMASVVNDLKNGGCMLPASLNALHLLIRWPKEDSDAAIDLLAKCSSQIEELEIELQRQDRREPIPLRPELLPNLSVYRGAWGCAEEFITGRPVHTILIDRALQARDLPITGFTRQDNENLLKIIATGTVPVRHLRFGVLSWKTTVLSAVADLFPQLETLRIDDRGPIVFEVRSSPLTRLSSC